MKKIFFITILITFAGVVMAQTGMGWSQQRAKVNFKDSINIASGLNDIK